AADAVKTLKELISTHPGIQTWAASDRRRGQAMLDRLSRHPAWWVRLYAAAVLVQHPVLTTPEILTRLKEDHDPSVARFVQR
ncbi:MAG: hypothetical protein ACE5ID_06185, partial [Acidobacteriota bacterium]